MSSRGNADSPCRIPPECCHRYDVGADAVDLQADERPAKRGSCNLSERDYWESRVGTTLRANVRETAAHDSLV